LAHATTITRSAGSQRTSVRHSLLKQERQYGNKYVGEVLRQTSGGDHEGGMDAIERSIDDARDGGRAMDHGTRIRMHIVQQNGDSIRRKETAKPPDEKEKKKLYAKLDAVR
jgi:hypothetical protein